MNQQYYQNLVTVRMLKHDILNRIEACAEHEGGPIVAVRRDTSSAVFGLGWFSRAVARREIRALRALEGIDGIPGVLSWDGKVLYRSWVEGEPMYRAQPRDAVFYRQALHLLREHHRRCVTHNDTSKEPNWLVQPDGTPGLLDYQMASVFRRRTRFMRMLAWDDFRHLLKHKRTYCPEQLTPIERRMLARKAWLSRVWRVTGKKVYRFVTRGILGWADREGSGERYTK